MALSPAEMGAAILRNLKNKTGKNIVQWLELIKETKLKDKKEIITYLKTEHSIGHFQAQKIYEEFKGINEYEQPEKLTSNLFNTPVLAKQFTRISEQIKALGQDVKMKPCRTYIPFSRKRQFAIVTVKKGKMVVGLNLPEAYQSSLVQPARNLGGTKRINYQFVVDAEKELSEKQVAIIRFAYENN